MDLQVKTTKPPIRTLDDSIYARLPEFFSKVVETVDSGHSRDMLLLATITVMSGLIPNVRTVYGDEEVYPSLYLLISAGSSKGKSIAKNSRHLLTNIKRREDSNFKIQQEQFQNREKKKKDDSEPIKKSILIPGNISAAALIESLFANGGKGIMIETEINSLTSSLGKEWGDFSHLLRCAGHHEPIEYKRKGAQPISIESPKLSILLTGTRNQVGALIGSPEDGLASRFIYYLGPSEQAEWKSQFKRSISIKERLMPIATQATRIYDNSNFPCGYSFTEAQKTWFDEAMDTRLGTLRSTFNEVPEELFFRHALQAVRLSMIFDSVSAFSEHSGLTQLHCTNESLSLACDIVSELFIHGLHAYDNLPVSLNLRMSTIIEEFYSLLPEQFDRTDAYEVGKKINRKERRVGDFLVKLEELGLIENWEHGKYRKLKS